MPRLAAAAFDHAVIRPLGDGAAAAGGMDEDGIPDFEGDFGDATD